MEEYKKLKQSLMVGDIRQYSDGVIVDTYDFVFGKDGDIVTIYNECNEEERKEFVSYVIECWDNDKEIETYIVSNEGVMDDATKEYFEWCQAHTRWYISTPPKS